MWNGEYPPADEYVGLTLAEARRRADRDERVEVIRVFDRDERPTGRRKPAITLDLNPERLNLELLSGVVTAAEWL